MIINKKSYLRKILYILTAILLYAATISFGNDNNNECCKTYAKRCQIPVDNLTQLLHEGKIINNSEIDAEGIIAFIIESIETNKEHYDKRPIIYDIEEQDDNNTKRRRMITLKRHDNITNNNVLAIRIDNSTIKGPLIFNNMIKSNSGNIGCSNEIKSEPNRDCNNNVAKNEVINQIVLSKNDPDDDYTKIKQFCGVDLDRVKVKEWIGNIKQGGGPDDITDRIYIVNAQISITNSEVVADQRTEDSILALNVFFCRDIDFSNTLLGNKADFHKAAFGGKAIFKDTRFNGDAKFIHAVFHNVADFTRSIFSKDMIAAKARYYDNATYTSSNFHGLTAFYLTTFDKEADFYHTTYDEQVFFTNSIFRGNVDLSVSTFNNLADFGNTTFIKKLSLAASFFRNYADFHNTIINQLNMKQAKYIQRSNIFADRFDLRSSIIKEAHIDDNIFKKDADFSFTCFGVFPSANFLDNESINIDNLLPCGDHITDGKNNLPLAIYEDNITIFDDLTIEGKTNFVRTVFKGGVYFNGDTFEKGVNFNDAVFGNTLLKESVISNFYDAIAMLYTDVFKVGVLISGEAYKNYFSEVLPDKLNRILRYGYNCYIEGRCAEDVRAVKKNYMFSYLNFNSIKINYEQLPAVSGWVNDNNSIRDSFIPDKENVSHIEPISASLKNFEAAFRANAQENDANKAIYNMYISKYREDLHENIPVNEDRKRITALENFFHTNKVLPIMKMVFFGIPSRFGRDLGRLMIFSLLILFAFTVAYMYGHEDCHRSCENFKKVKCKSQCDAYKINECDTLRRKEGSSSGADESECHRFSLRLIQFPVEIDFKKFDYKYKKHFDLFFELAERLILLVVVVLLFLFAIYNRTLVLNIISGLFIIALILSTLRHMSTRQMSDGKLKDEITNIGKEIERKRNDIEKLNCEIDAIQKRQSKKNGACQKADKIKTLFDKTIDKIKDEYKEFTERFKNRFPDAFLLSLVLLFKIGYNDTVVRSSSLYVLCFIEWIMGYIIYMHLLYTLKNTVPFLGQLLNMI
ncbi:MAG: hypothetical protein HQK95_05860 [Nitrospirae bacterium]|nr:hypothetical protein [Nitrospirota bacterium]